MHIGGVSSLEGSVKKRKFGNCLPTSHEIKGHRVVRESGSSSANVINSGVIFKS